MKKPSVRPIFSIVLLVTAAATLTFRTIISGGGAPFSMNFSPVDPPVFNSTLLKLAAVDLSESSLRQDVEQLVEGHFRTGQGRQRSFLSSGRYRIDVRARSARGDPVQLRSPEFYRLWLEFRRHLQNWSRARSFQPEIMSELADLGKGSIDRNDGVLSSGRKYKSCAVVGNSGILLNTVLGEEIDSHEFVIRLNNARTTSYERNVGSKTSLSFVNSNILHLCARREGCFCHPYGEKVPIIMYMCQAVHFLDYTVCNSSHKAPLIITDPRFDVLCSRIVKYYSLQRFLKETGKSVDEWASAHDGVNFHYSSGMQAVMLAVGICDKVSIFGFGKSESAKHHYHTNQKGELQLHDYLAEYDLYNDLVRRPQVIPFISDKFKFPPVVMHK